MSKSDEDIGREVYRSATASVVPSDEELVPSAVQYAVNRLIDAAGLTDFLPYYFGSVRSLGLREDQSDIDVVLMDQVSCRFMGSSPDCIKQVKEEEKPVLEKIKQCALNAGVTCELLSGFRISHLRLQVPLDKEDGSFIQVDLTVHRRNGLRNSALLRAYMEQLPVARLLCIAVKKWSKRVGVNFSVGGKLSSYALTIMVVWYLLRCRRLKYVKPKTIHALHIPNIPYKIPLPMWSEEDRGKFADLGALARGFLKFYGYECNLQEEVVSLHHPFVPLRKEEYFTRFYNLDAMQTHLCIEDPYEPFFNLGGHVNAVQRDMLVEEMKKSMKCGFEEA